MSWLGLIHHYRSQQEFPSWYQSWLPASTCVTIPHSLSNEECSCFLIKIENGFVHWIVHLFCMLGQLVPTKLITSISISHDNCSHKGCSFSVCCLLKRCTQLRSSLVSKDLFSFPRLKLHKVLSNIWSLLVISGQSSLLNMLRGFNYNTS